MKIKVKNRSYGYDTDWPRSRHKHKYIKYKRFFSMMIFTCIKQHLSKIWNSICEKFKEHLSWKSVVYNIKSMYSKQPDLTMNFLYI